MIKKIYDKNREFAIIKYSENIYTNYKKHMHPILSFGAIEEGSGLVLFNDKNIELSHNNLVIFNRYELHCTKNINGKGYYNLYINSNWLESNFNSLIVCKNVINFNILNDIKEALFNNKSQNLVEVIKFILSNSCKEFKDNRSDIVKSIIKYIHSNIKEKISIDLIAKELSYNKEYLIRKFKDEMHITPQQYIISLKAHISSNSLIDSNSNIVDISYEFSFFDQSHYNKSFKNIYGVSPKKYKKSIIYK